MSSICERCKSRIFSSEAFPKLLVGGNLDQAPGIRYQTNYRELEESVLAGCVFCALLKEYTLKGNEACALPGKQKINLWIYGVPIPAGADDAAATDISKLFVDASPLGCSSFFVYADEGKQSFYSV